MRLSYTTLTLAVALVVGGFATAAAQEPAAPLANGRTAVFLDCHSRLCDFDHFRREISFVNWVRDRQDADVHVLITQQGTAAGGSRFTLSLIGLRAMAARQDTVFYVTNVDDTYEEERAGLTSAVALGLVPYVWHTRAFQRLSLAYAAPADTTRSLLTESVDDPWDYWVFRIGLRGSMEGESQERFLSGNTSVSADRTTEALKIELGVRASGSRSEFDVVDEAEGLDTTYVSTRTAYSFDGLAVWSLGPHWSAGVMAELDRNSTLNWDLAIQGGPAVEYNIFPWDESTWRRLTLRYVIGISAYNYTEETIYDQLAEVRPAHTLEVDIGVQQPWGSIRGSLDAFQYLHDLTKHSVSVGGGVNLRVFRGLDFSIGGSVARIKDQLYLSKAGLTTEEILLRQQQRGTEFRFGMDLGLSYRFGSKFNNVVNPRM
jgi:hypothetical protein